MATSSITANFYTDDPKAANRFVRALFTKVKPSPLPPSLKPYEFKTESEKRAFFRRLVKKADSIRADV